MSAELRASEDLYRTLQVEPSADLEAIHAAYRRLARLYHPDLNPRPEAAERMRAINAAYRVLSDPRQRATYDAQRFLRPSPVVATMGVRPRGRPVVVAPPVYEPPTPLQRRVDRIVIALGIVLIICMGVYSVLLIPRAQRVARPAAPTVGITTATDGDVAQRLLRDPGLRSFPGTVLLPPTTLAPFKDLPIMRLDATSQGIARYAVYYGDITTGVASISGLTGRNSFDAAAPHLAGCSPDSIYCTGLAIGQSATDPPGVELFQPAHLVGDDPAFAVHRTCCSGTFWSLDWYDPMTNMSYTLDFSRSVAMDFNDPRAVGALVGQLVRLP